MNTPSAPRDAFLADVIAGLSTRPRGLSPKYFYDAKGSALFERICALPEYYPTRTEIGILGHAAPRIAARVGFRPLIIEFGSGASVKVRLLLDAFAAPAGYVAVEISRAALDAATARLRADYPRLPIHAIHADYTRPFALPAGLREAAGAVMGFFPGSTIGNFAPEAAAAFLDAARQDVGPGGWMVLGADLVKDPRVLEAAYDDPAGVTAAFNKNVLARINRELGGDFDLDRFRHRAFFNADESRIEMHLESMTAQTVSVGGERFGFTAGETIHTENSHKFTTDGVRALADRAGFELVEIFTDARGWFGVFLLRAR